MTESPQDRARWTERYATDLRAGDAPSSWVIAASGRIPQGSLVVDIAAGSGRHAAPLAALGHHVIAVDFVALAIRHAVLRSQRIHGVVATVWSLPLRKEFADAVLCTNFLERELFGDLKALVRQGGLLIYETYTLEHRHLVEAGRARAPRSADYLLAPGELLDLVTPFEILDAREGYVKDDLGERYCASVIARKSPL
jgi:SAM-dependent methyltransferase